MFTLKDIEARTIFVVNCIEHDKSLRVKNGELLLEEQGEDKTKTLTIFPFQKILALFIIGHISVSTPLIEKCRKFNVALVVMKPNLRPIFYWADAAEANFLLRQRQHSFPKDDLSVARFLVTNKIRNQLTALKKTRKKDELMTSAIHQCETALSLVGNTDDYNTLMGIEGVTSKSYFSAYFQGLMWQGRKPRVKNDAINVTLDIGYTLLFNYIECFVRMFGFDLYIGVYHRLWFRRKSLVCDLMEPFRCLIDHAVLLAFHRKQFKPSDFELTKHEYHLKKGKSADYYRVFFDVLKDRKGDIFRFVQAYYRCFMGRKSVSTYKEFVF